MLIVPLLVVGLRISKLSFWFRSRKASFVFRSHRIHSSLKEFDSSGKKVGQLPPLTNHPLNPTNSIVEELTNYKKFSFKTAERDENDENSVPNYCVYLLLSFCYSGDQ